MSIEVMCDHPKRQRLMMELNVAEQMVFLLVDRIIWIEVISVSLNGRYSFAAD